jgi:hypothetical protein
VLRGDIDEYVRNEWPRETGSPIEVIDRARELIDLYVCPLCVPRDELWSWRRASSGPEEIGRSPVLKISLSKRAVARIKAAHQPG